MAGYLLRVIQVKPVERNYMKGASMDCRVFPATGEYLTRLNFNDLFSMCNLHIHIVCLQYYTDIMLKLLGISKLQDNYLCTEKYRIMVREVPRKQYFPYLLITGIKSLYIFWRSRWLSEKGRDIAKPLRNYSCHLLAIRTTNGFWLYDCWLVQHCLNFTTTQSQLLHNFRDVTNKSCFRYKSM